MGGPLNPPWDPVPNIEIRELKIGSESAKIPAYLIQHNI
jgi:hypothetical protein